MIFLSRIPDPRGCRLTCVVVSKWHLLPFGVQASAPLATCWKVLLSGGGGGLTVGLLLLVARFPPLSLNLVPFCLWRNLTPVVSDKASNLLAGVQGSTSL